MRSWSSRCSGYAVDRHGKLTAAPAPPLAEVLQPFVALVLGIVHVVPDGEVGEARLTVLFDPDREIGLVVLGYSELRDLDVELDLRRKGGPGEHDRHGNRNARAHGSP